jgi:uncharacterized SAM-binding protein YcdF (DUF218 family)
VTFALKFFARKRLNLRWAVLGVTLGLTIAVFVWHRAVLTSMAAWLDVGEKPQRCDLVLLLNGDYNTRPFVAAALVKGRWAPRVAFAKCKRSPAEIDGSIPLNEEMNFRIFQHCGLSKDDVVMLSADADTTFDEVKALSVYLDQQPAAKIAVVTEGPHTRRAKWIVEKVLGRKVERIVMITAPMDDFQANNWWRNEIGVLFILSEYAKLVFYWFRYGLLAYELAAVAMVAFLIGWLVLFWRRAAARTSRS